MTRRFIATVVAAALAITAFGSAPVRADEDLARALAAIVGIAIVGKVIKDKLDDDKDDRKVVTRQRYDDRYDYSRQNNYKRQNSYNRQGTYSNRNTVNRNWEPRPLPRRADRRLLPGNCLRSFDTRDGRYRVFGRNCLQQNYGFTNSLPRACKVKFKAHKKTRHGYDARCLRREGYQLARR